jgi:hypothetical protein
MFSRWIVTNITSASVTTFLAFLAGIISWSVYCRWYRLFGGTCCFHLHRLRTSYIKVPSSLRALKVNKCSLLCDRVHTKPVFCSFKPLLNFQVFPSCSVQSFVLLYLEPAARQEVIGCCVLQRPDYIKQERPWRQCASACEQWKSKPVSWQLRLYTSSLSRNTFHTELAYVLSQRDKMRWHLNCLYAHWINVITFEIVKKSYGFLSRFFVCYLVMFCATIAQMDKLT